MNECRTLTQMVVQAMNDNRNFWYYQAIEHRCKSIIEQIDEHKFDYIMENDVVKALVVNR